jgi:hypothetical protein
MPGMILPALLSALTLQGIGDEGDPDLAWCEVRFAMLYGHPIRIRTDCPDVENRDAMRNQSHAQLRDSEPSLMDIDEDDNVGRIYFRYEDHGDFIWWRLQPGLITRIEPEYPQAAERAGISAACVSSYDVIDGNPENICIRCRASEMEGHFTREMRRSIRRSYYVDHDDPLAMTFVHRFEQPGLPAPALPDFCEGGDE